MFSSEGVHIRVSVLYIVVQVGKPTDDWKNDPEGIPEAALSKAVRGATKFASQVSKDPDQLLCDQYAISYLCSV